MLTGRWSYVGELRLLFELVAHRRGRRQGESKDILKRDGVRPKGYVEEGEEMIPENFGRAGR